jgi:hypothetical protein
MKENNETAEQEKCINTKPTFSFGARVLILKSRYPPFSKRGTNVSSRSIHSRHMWLKFKDITAAQPVK